MQAYAGVNLVYVRNLCIFCKCIQTRKEFHFGSHHAPGPRAKFDTGLGVE